MATKAKSKKGQAVTIKNRLYAVMIGPNIIHDDEGQVAIFKTRKAAKEAARNWVPPKGKTLYVVRLGDVSGIYE